MAVLENQVWSWAGRRPEGGAFLGASLSESISDRWNHGRPLWQDVEPQGVFGTELLGTSQRQGRRNTRLSFPNNFQPPISTHYGLNPAAKGTKETQPAAASHAARGRAREG